MLQWNCSAEGRAKRIKRNIRQFCDESKIVVMDHVFEYLRAGLCFEGGQSLRQKVEFFSRLERCFLSCHKRYLPAKRPTVSNNRVAIASPEHTMIDVVLFPIHVLLSEL